MSLTSYRAAPPRANACEFGFAKPQAVGLDRGRSRRRAQTQTAALRKRHRGVIVEDRFKEALFVLGRPGNDLLSRVLRHSTIGAEEFNGRVRDGIGFFSSSLKSPDRRRTNSRQGGQGPHPELCSSKVKVFLFTVGAIGPVRVRKADRPPVLMHGTAKGTDVPAGV
jgi:hypothetical protein